MGDSPDEERRMAEERRQVDLAEVRNLIEKTHRTELTEVRSLVDKMQLVLKSIPQPVQASIDAKWTKWVLGAMVAGLSLMMTVLSLFMFLLSTP